MMRWIGLEGHILEGIFAAILGVGRGGVRSSGNHAVYIVCRTHARNTLMETFGRASSS